MKAGHSELFEKAKFTGRYFEKEKAFWSNHFLNENDLMDFFAAVFLHDSVDSSPRRMMNLVERWVTLADDMEKIRPQYDSLKIVCYRACIEGLYKQIGNKDGKESFFADNLLNDDLQRLSTKINTVSDCFDNSRIERSANIIHPLDGFVFAIRNEVVHDGDFWESQLFISDDVGIISSVSDKKKATTKMYESELTYKEFKEAFVRAAINLIMKTIRERKPNGTD